MARVTTVKCTCDRCGETLPPIDWKQVHAAPGERIEVHGSTLTTAVSEAVGRKELLGACALELCEACIWSFRYWLSPSLPASDEPEPKTEEPVDENH